MPTRRPSSSGALRSSNIRIIDHAEQPRSPISPNRKLDILLGIAGGLIVAVAFAFFFEYLDNRLKDPDEISAYLGLAPLATIFSGFDGYGCASALVVRSSEKRKSQRFMRGTPARVA